MEINCYPDFEKLTDEAVRFITQWAGECVELRGSFTLVLSGGNTPRPLYEALSSKDHRDLMPWLRTHIFWGDERCVPKDHPACNYGMAYESMLKRIDIPPENIHRIQGEIDPPEDAAAEYESDLRDFFMSSCGRPSSITPASEDGFPSFDLVLLGLGEDGHTASLFPGDAALKAAGRWVVAVRNPQAKPPVPRITLTLPTINEARCVLFLVSGEAKRRVMQAVWDDMGKGETEFPAARVRPRGRLLWFYS